MLARVIYKGGLRTEATHLRSGTTIETDAPVDNQGKGERFSPTDLVSVALATCIVTTIGIASDTRDIDITGTECEVEKIMDSNPRKIGEIRIKLTFPKDKQYTDREKMLLENVANTCPVARSLHPDLKQTLTFVWP
ncbi:MAG: osmotically inducible protein OsmC [Bacteroidetes bacterium 43-93]|nr:OsmC family protein [Bacteroidota bacterium]OJW95536.1 MAG: osmotically inducible protein OsmC [Bacteroidetes bacterium 43-93]